MVDASRIASRRHAASGSPPAGAPLLGLLVAACAGCQAGGTDAPSVFTPGTLVFEEALDVSFELPADWIARRERSGTVFSHALDGAEALATLTLQAMPRAAPDLEAVLLASRSKLEADEGFVWNERAMMPLGDHEALFFAERFVWNDVTRERRGVLFATPEALVELAYTAPSIAFAAELPVYERALETLIAPWAAAP